MYLVLFCMDTVVIMIFHLEVVFYVAQPIFSEQRLFKAQFHLLFKTGETNLSNRNQLF